MPLAARSPSTTSCSYQTSYDGGALLPSNSTIYCDDASDGGVVALTLCIIGPFVLVIMIFLGYLLLQWIRPRNGPSRGRNHDSPKPDSDSDTATLEKVDLGGKGGGNDGSATCVSVDNPAGEVDISSLSYHDQPQSNHSVMPFLPKGLFRAMSSSSCPAESQGAPPVYSFQATQSTTQHTDNDGVSDADPGSDIYADAGAGGAGGTDPYCPPTPTFQSPPALATTTSRLRSFSESTITLSSSSQFHSAHQSGPGSREPSTSLPSSPSIPPPPTGTRSGTGTGNSGTLSTFSLSLSEKLERLNKQMMQKKASNSSLTGSEPDSPICGSPGSTGKGSGHGQTDDGDTSMDFKCKGLPESGTFSVLTNMEAALRVEDELATIERLALRV